MMKVEVAVGVDPFAVRSRPQAGRTVPGVLVGASKLKGVAETVPASMHVLSRLSAGVLLVRLGHRQLPLQWMELVLSVLAHRQLAFPWVKPVLSSLAVSPTWPRLSHVLLMSLCLESDNRCGHPHPRQMA